MATDLSSQVAGIKDDYKYGFRDSDDHYSFKSGKGPNREVVQQISEMKSEPQWMRDIRLKALTSSGRSRPRPGAATSATSTSIYSTRPIVALLQTSETCGSLASPSHPCAQCAIHPDTDRWRL